MHLDTHTPLSVHVLTGEEVDRAGLRALIASDPRLRSVDGRAAGARIAVVPEDAGVILLDPGGDLLPEPEDLAALVRMRPGSRICVRTARFTLENLLAVMSAGASGYVLKGAGRPAMLCDALVLIGRYGAAVIDPEIMAHFQRFSDQAPVCPPPTTPHPPTPTHRQWVQP